MEVRQREVVELQSQVKSLGQEDSDGRRQLLESKFQELLDPLRRRRNFLVASREVHQFNRDVEDEIVRTLTSSGSVLVLWFTTIHSRFSSGRGLYVQFCCLSVLALRSTGDLSRMSCLQPEISFKIKPSLASVCRFRNIDVKPETDSVVINFNIVATRWHLVKDPIPSRFQLSALSHPWL